LKWRNAAQEAAQQLYDKFNDPKPEMDGFLNQLHIDFDLIQYDTDSEMFY